MEAWKYLKNYYQEQVDAITSRFLVGDDIKDSERYQVVGLVRLMNHIEESAKKIANGSKGNQANPE
jgi:hypothetical protein